MDKTMAWANFSSDKGFEHFDPFAGVVDIVGGDKNRNVRYGIRFCGESYLTPANTITEVVQNHTIYTLPNMPIWITGMINLRGNVVPVFDLNVHPDYKVPAQISDAKVSNKLIVIDQDKSAVGLFIDNYPVVINLDGDDVSKAPNSGVEPKVAGEHLLGAIKVGESIYYEIDFDAFFTKLIARMLV